MSWKGSWDVARDLVETFDSVVYSVESGEDTPGLHYKQPVLSINDYPVCIDGA